MKYEKYSVRASGSFRRFAFYSEGPKGRIAKVVLFEAMDKPFINNLAFGDLTENGDIDDIVVTNNKDTEKVLATIALTIKKFFNTHPGEWLYLKGSTEARTRLYQSAISKNFDFLKGDFEILGFVNNNWRPFKSGTTYQCFIVGLKKKISL